MTLPSLQDTDIADYGYQLGRAWGIGQKTLNNGALLIVAPNERKVRIEVGYGLEPILTDALTSVVIQRAILPRFKAGDMPGGIEAGVTAITSALTDENSEWRQRAAEAAKARGEEGQTCDLRPHRHPARPRRLALHHDPGLPPIGRRAACRAGDRGGGPPAMARSSWPDFPGGGGFSGGGGGSSGGGGFSGGGGSFGGGGSSGSW